MAEKKTEKKKDTIAISVSVLVSEFGSDRVKVREKIVTALVKSGYHVKVGKTGEKTKLHKAVSQMDIETQKEIIEVCKKKGIKFE